MPAFSHQNTGQGNVLEMTQDYHVLSGITVSRQCSSSYSTMFFEQQKCPSSYTIILVQFTSQPCVLGCLWLPSTLIWWACTSANRKQFAFITTLPNTYFVTRCVRAYLKSLISLSAIINPYLLGIDEIKNWCRYELLNISIWASITHAQFSPGFLLFLWGRNENWDCGWWWTPIWTFYQGTYSILMSQTQNERQEARSALNTVISSSKRTTRVSSSSPLLGRPSPHTQFLSSSNNSHGGWGMASPGSNYREHCWQEDGRLEGSFVACLASPLAGQWLNQGPGVRPSAGAAVCF